MTRRVTVVLAAVLAVAGLTACEKPAPCLRGHNETYYRTIGTGTHAHRVPDSRWVCDQRAEKTPAPSAGSGS